MDFRLVQADTNGVIRKAGTRGVGFSIRPAVDPWNNPAAQPGELPVLVKFSSEGDRLPVLASDSVWRKEPFAAFDVQNATPGGVYLIETYQNPGEGRVSAGRQALVKIPITSAPVALSNAAYADMVPALNLRQGLRGWNFYFSGAGIGAAGAGPYVNIGIKMAGGAYYDAGSNAQIDPGAEKVAYRAAVPGGAQMSLQLSAVATISVEIEAIYEVG